MKFFKNLAAIYLKVDLRVLGIFRMALGLVCFLDVLRRLPYIEVFYSSKGVAPNYFMSEITGKYSSKAFTLLSSLNSVGEITLFFYIIALFSFFLMIGYKTKISHVIVLIGILSIHNRLIILENGGDLVLNNFLIWSLFLPLGRRFSFDRMLSSLNIYEDKTPKSLNARKGTKVDEPSAYWGLAYFACLLQLSIIYIFNFFNKDGSTWEEGTSIFYFYHLDTFLTPFGNFIKEFGLMPVTLSKILTYMTMTFEILVPFLILAPLFSLWTRRFSFVVMVGFHIVIGISLYIGTFSWIMIAALILLISSKDMELLKAWLKKTSTGPYIVFYDSDCGFCHQTARIIKRMDLFDNLTWAGKDWDGDRPKVLENLRDRTIVVWNQNSDKIYTRHIAFSRIISSLPFGFLDAWILRIPGISHLAGFIYDIIARNRGSISKFFGYSSCDISKEYKESSLVEAAPLTPLNKVFTIIVESVKTVTVFILILATLQYAATKNDGFRDWMKDNGYTPPKYNSKLNKISKQTRMIQKWNMFSPNTPRSYQWCIIEATLQDGSIIDLMTGEPPIYDKLSYNDTYSQIDNSQFWRKYFSRVAKKNYKRYRPQFKKVMLSQSNPIKPREDLNQDGTVSRLDQIKSVKLFKLSKSISSPLVDSKRSKKVRKNEIDLDNASKSKSKHNTPKKRVK